MEESDASGRRVPVPLNYGIIFGRFFFFEKGLPRVTCFIFWLWLSGGKIFHFLLNFILTLKLFVSSVL